MEENCEGKQESYCPEFVHHNRKSSDMRYLFTDFIYLFLLLFLKFFSHFSAGCSIFHLTFSCVTKSKCIYETTISKPWRHICQMANEIPARRKGNHAFVLLLKEEARLIILHGINMEDTVHLGSEHLADFSR